MWRNQSQIRKKLALKLAPVSSDERKRGKVGGGRNDREEREREIERERERDTEIERE